jgi:hypothetical protein
LDAFRTRDGPVASSADQQRRRREYRGSAQGLKLDVSSLALNLLPLRWVGDGFRTLIHVALTARGQLESGPSPGLKEAESGRPEGKEEHQSPRPWSARGDQGDSEDHGHREGQGAEEQPIAPLTRTDVRRPHG